MTTNKDFKEYSSVVLSKAKDIIDKNGVKLIEESKRLKHFVVAQASGEYCDVWFTIDIYGRSHWSCNAVVDGNGCVFRVKDSTKPFCSHTLACQLYYLTEKIIGLEAE